MAKFVSKCENLVICMIPSDKQVLNGFVTNIKGEHVRFDNGKFETDSRTKDGQKVDEFIRNHRLFGSMIFEDKKGAEE